MLGSDGNLWLVSWPHGNLQQTVNTRLQIDSNVATIQIMISWLGNNAFVLGSDGNRRLTGSSPLPTAISYHRVGRTCLLRQALKSEPITVHGDGSQVRTLTPIDDVINGIVAPLRRRCEVQGQIINITGTEQISAIDMARQIKKLTASTSEIVFVSQRQYNIQTEDPDVSKAKNLLHPKPRLAKVAPDVSVDDVVTGARMHKKEPRAIYTRGAWTVDCLSFGPLAGRQLGCRGMGLPLGAL